MIESTNGLWGIKQDEGGQHVLDLNNMGFTHRNIGRGHRSSETGGEGWLSNLLMILDII